MNCQELAKRIENLQPKASTLEVARLCLLLCNSVEHIDELENEKHLTRVWNDLLVRLDAITDQHEAMTAELEKLSSIKPDKLTAEQILVLFRAIKVQNQVVRLYVDNSAVKTRKKSKRSGSEI